MNNSDKFNEFVNENPDHISIELTTKCNAKCIMCPHCYETFGKDIDRTLLDKIFTQAADNLIELEFCGLGEPFLYPLLYKVLDEYSKKDIMINLTTSGLLKNDKLMRKIVRSNIILKLSIDGASEETYEYFRNPLKWNNFIKFLECFHKNITEAANERKVYFIFLIVGMKKNITELEEIVKLAHKYSAQAILLRELQGKETFIQVNDQSIIDIPEIFADNYHKALMLANKYNIIFYVEPFYQKFINNYCSPDIETLTKINQKLSERKEEESFVFKEENKRNKHEKQTQKMGAKIQGRTCQLPWHNTYFTIDGKVRTCHYNPNFMGYLSQNSWEEIWNGSIYRNLRRNIYGWNPNSSCRNCGSTFGITGGNKNMFNEYFNSFKKESLSINSNKIHFDKNFYHLEYYDNQISHIWMNKQAKVFLPMKKSAKFLCIKIFKHCPINKLTPGKCIINGGFPQPFDNSNDKLYFPIEHIKTDILEIYLEMENEYKIEPDTRSLSLPIRGFEYLY